jgi:hypothetical protein
VSVRVVSPPRVNGYPTRPARTVRNATKWARGRCGVMCVPPPHFADLRFSSRSGGPCASGAENTRMSHVSSTGLTRPGHSSSCRKRRQRKRSGSRFHWWPRGAHGAPSPGTAVVPPPGGSPWGTAVPAPVPSGAGVGSTGYVGAWSRAAAASRERDGRGPHCFFRCGRVPRCRRRPLRQGPAPVHRWPPSGPSRLVAPFPAPLREGAAPSSPSRSAAPSPVARAVPRAPERERGTARGDAPRRGAGNCAISHDVPDGAHRGKGQPAVSLPRRRRGRGARAPGGAWSGPARGPGRC